MPIVTDQGFTTDDFPSDQFLTPETIDAGGGRQAALEVANDFDPRTLVVHFNAVDLIVIVFPSFADGRGFSLAKLIRRLGYGGRLRAKGHVIADQYPLARACGFDEVEIDDGLAARQPEAQWLRVQATAGRQPSHALRARKAPAAQRVQ